MVGALAKLQELRDNCSDDPEAIAHWLSTLSADKLRSLNVAMSSKNMVWKISQLICMHFSLELKQINTVK